MHLLIRNCISHPELGSGSLLNNMVDAETSSA